MTLQQIVDRIKLYAHIGATGTTNDEITDVIIRAINDARRDIMLEIPRYWLRKTGTIRVVQGTATYSLASDVLEPLFFWYTFNSSDFFLCKVDNEEDFRNYVYSSSATQADPTHYFDAGIDGSSNRQIIVSPTPKQSLTVNYTYYKTATTSELSTSDLASAIPEIPSHLHNAVWKGGLYYFAKYIDNQALLALSKGDYGEALAQIRINEDRNLDHKAAFKFSHLKVRRY